MLNNPQFAKQFGEGAKMVIDEVNKKNGNIDTPDITEGEYNLGEDDFVKYLEGFQQKQWEREDAIRKETQLREDTAYERAINSMRRAGVNPNLIGNITPAASGGGTTNATGIDWNPYSDKTDAEIAKYQKEMESKLQKSLQQIEQAFEKGENNKDRITDIITSLFDTLTLGIFKKI